MSDSGDGDGKKKSKDGLIMIIIMLVIVVAGLTTMLAQGGPNDSPEEYCIVGADC